MRVIQGMLVLFLLLGTTRGSEILVSRQDGLTYVLEVDPQESMEKVEERIRELNGDSAFIVSLPPTMQIKRRAAVQQGGYLGYPRDYTAEVTHYERADIRFIVSSLADKSLMSIAFIKGDLESAGDRIDHVHPLRFLMTIFVDEEMKVAIRNIRGRGWIWNQFVDGIKDSLSTEANIGNLRDEHIVHFASTLGLDPRRLYPSILAQNWEGLIDTLIREVPRRGDHDRYDN